MKMSIYKRQSERQNLKPKKSLNSCLKTRSRNLERHTNF